MKIAIATGTRADWGLLFPLACRLRDCGADVAVMACHQHLILRQGHTIDEIIRDGFSPSHQIKAEGSAPEIMAMAAAGFTSALADEKPDAIIILGDRCEMLGAASAALLSGTPIIHIAGGTVSEGAFDDSVRHAITKMATLHFPETPLCAKRILAMGEDPESVITAGALGVENALSIPLMDRDTLAASLDGWNPGDDFLVVTLHAATLEEGNPVDVQNNMLIALATLPDNFRFLITYPNSDIDPAPLIHSLHDFENRSHGRVKVIPSLGRIRYLSAASLSRGVVGNSSSGLVEIPSLGVPTLDIGMRQKGRECGPSVIHCGISEGEISDGLRRLISPKSAAIAAKRENPYSRPHTASLMADTILSRKFTPFPQKKFFLK